MLEVGFELEFASNLSHSQIMGAMRLLFPGATGRKKRERFSLGTDGSVWSSRGWVEYELRTPVWPMKQGIKNLCAILTYFRLIGVEINKSCGLHVNLGFVDPEKTKKLDPVAVVMLSDEDRWLKEFKRQDNNFCLPMTRRIKMEQRIADSLYATVEQVVLIDRDHHYAVALDKLRERKGRGWVEFRMIGNTNYHLRPALITEAIACFANAMKDAASGKRRRVVKQKLDHFEQQWFPQF